MGELLRFEVVSGSMSPTLEIGDAVWVEREAPVGNGDVALFVHESGKVICHRIVGALRTPRGRRYLHRGDAGGPVGMLAGAALLGRVIERERVGRREALPRLHVAPVVVARAWWEWLARRVRLPVPRPFPVPETDPVHIGVEYDRTAASARDWARKDPRAAARFWSIEQPMRAAVLQAEHVLDLGCGWGRVLDDLPKDHRVVGVDVSFESLRVAAGNGHRVARADAHRLPFPDASFDLVIAAKAVFRHLDTPRALAECARVLRPGGRLFAHFLNARGLALRPRTDPFGLVSAGALDDVASSVGLRRERTYLYRNLRFRPYSIRLPAIFASRLFSHAIVVWRHVAPR